MSLEVLVQEFITVIDTDCNSKQSIGAIVDILLQRDIDVVIGPPCAQVVEPVGELLAYRDIPLMNWVSLGQTIYYKEDLDTYIRTMATIATLGDMMTFFYYYTGWRRLVLISSDGDDYRGGAETIESALARSFWDPFLVVHHYSDVRINASIAQIDQMWSSIIFEARIIVLVIPQDELRTYMVRAHLMGMTGGDYQFLYADTQPADSAALTYINSVQLWKQGDQYDEAARQAFTNVLYFGLGLDSRNVSDWQNEAYDAYNNIFSGRTDIPAPTEPDQFSAYLHDTIVLYARALNDSLTGGSDRSGSSIYQYASFVLFKGLSGDVVMGNFADRQPTFFVYDMDLSGIFQEVARLQFVINDNETAFNTTWLYTKIIWGDGRTTDDPYMPPDTPPCGFFNENCPPESEEDNTLVIVLSVCIPLVVVLMVAFLIFRWWRRERALQNMSWKINYSDLNFNFQHKKLQSSFMQASRALSRSAASVDSTSVYGTIRSGATSAQTSRHSVTRGQIFTTVAMYKAELVAVKWSAKKKIQTDRAFLLHMKEMHELKHVNLTTFVGLSISPEKICCIWEYCTKGSIQDVIENDDIHLDTMFKLSLVVDICQGLEYIHKSSIRYHGNLRSSNCVIDSRWVCKLTDFGMEKLKPLHDTVENLGEHAFYAKLFWTAPEILRKILKKEVYENTSQADVYATGVLIKELLCRNEPYSTHTHLTPKEIIIKVAIPEDPDKLFRPAIADTELDSEYRRTSMLLLIHRCWAEDPESRPSIKTALRTLDKINPYKKTSVVDNMIAMMEKYTNNLEEIVTERTEQLQEEKLKTDALLYRMLPRKVAEDLKIGRAVQAEAFDSVTIYFSDIVRFTDLASESTPLEIVVLLNALYTLFDDIISHYDVYKVETIGDAYMIVSGLPEKNGNLHVKEIAGVALNILESVITFEIPHKPDRQLQIRIGLHTGPVVTGVVGLTMPRYCLFGDTVNTASRMESNGEPLKIHISPSTQEALMDFPAFVVEDRGEIPIKGKGMMRTYWLSGLYIADDDVCMETLPTDKSALHKDNSLENLKENGTEDDDSELEDDKDAGKPGLGKISVADSGICMDKSIGKDGNTHNNKNNSGDIYFDSNNADIATTTRHKPVADENITRVIQSNNDSPKYSEIIAEKVPTLEVVLGYEASAIHDDFDANTLELANNVSSERMVPEKNKSKTSISDVQVPQLADTRNSENTTIRFKE
ncbi:atrial natriuretic peptide receptor 1-like [Mercenaria mercenaria]|uniref:atrial natriuretic peptide receptor 1-like n=1 Tax=Mercenaria mercenaria TaxID=6596 RepID=UPI00234EB983|nr:atrial natriuretic peptide receptor 1-like [Mercenaria mercenaria]